MRPSARSHPPFRGLLAVGAVVVFLATMGIQALHKPVAPARDAGVRAAASSAPSPVPTADVGDLSAVPAIPTLKRPPRRKARRPARTRAAAPVLAAAPAAPAPAAPQPVVQAPPPAAAPPAAAPAPAPAPAPPDTFDSSG
jgi:hypothetical protein